MLIEWKKNEHIKILNLSNENVDRNIIIKKLNELKNLVNFLDARCEKIKDKFDFYKEEIDLNLCLFLYQNNINPNLCRLIYKYII